MLSNTTGQSIDFAKIPTNIALQIRGAITRDTLIALNHFMEGEEIDTISILKNLNLSTIGTYQITAFISSPASDLDRSDDTVRTSVSINPALSVSISPITSEPTYCIAKGMGVNPEVTVTNTGNMNIQEISLVFHVSNANTTLQTIPQTIQVNLRPNDDTTIRLASSYTVPSDAYYYVDVTVYLTCDSALANNQTPFLRECVDIEDIALVQFIKPYGGIDSVKTNKEISVLLENYGAQKYYNNALITAWIEDANRIRIQPELTGNLPDTGISPASSFVYTFPTTYSVPDMKEYYIKVFIEKLDNYPTNDTLSIRRETNSTVGIITSIFDGLSLGQNIPNPAKQNTRIEYSIPNSGEVIFTVHSVSGQVLYTKTIQSETGKQFIDLNTNDFSAGVYFYSMEYKGQKLVKRMSVRN